MLNVNEVVVFVCIASSNKTDVLMTLYPSNINIVLNFQHIII